MAISPSTLGLVLSLESRLNPARILTITMTKRHSKFYFDETPVVIQVEGTLFKVHRYHLLESETFSDMFIVPQGCGSEPEGATPERPLVLNGVTALDFEALLTVLYARHCSNVQLNLTPPLIFSAFRLSHMWNFLDLQAYLLLQAEKILDSVDKINFANTFDIRSWLVPAYLTLCQRSTPPTTYESTRLGVHNLLMVFRLREQYRPWDPIWVSISEPDDSVKYCNACFGYSYYTPPPSAKPFRSFGQALEPSSPQFSTSTHKCSKCGNETKSFFKRNSCTESSGVNDSVESQLEKWVEGGCEPE